MYPTTTSGRPSLEKSPPLEGSRGQCAMSFHAASSDMPDAPSLSCAIGYWLVSMTLRKPYFHPSVGVSASSGKAARAAAAASNPMTVDRKARVRMADASPRTWQRSRTIRALPRRRSEPHLIPGRISRLPIFVRRHPRVEQGSARCELGRFRLGEIVDPTSRAAYNPPRVAARQRAALLVTALVGAAAMLA